MSDIGEIPLSSTPQSFSIQLGSVTYTLTVTYHDTDEGGWILDIDDVSGNNLVSGIPLVTGADLLAQYGYLGIGGKLYVQTDGLEYEDVPTFENLGSTSHVYFVPDE